MIYGPRSDRWYSPIHSQQINKKKNMQTGIEVAKY